MAQQITYSRVDTVQTEPSTSGLVQQIIWYVVGVIEVLLGFRIIFKVLAANPNNAFSNLIYSLTNLLILPFRGIFGVGVSGNSVLEPAAIVAMVVYFVMGWGIVYLISLITRKEVSE